MILDALLVLVHELEKATCNTQYFFLIFICFYFFILQYVPFTFIVSVAHYAQVSKIKTVGYRPAKLLISYRVCDLIIVLLSFSELFFLFCYFCARQHYIACIYALRTRVVATVIGIAIGRFLFENYDLQICP